jgi:hypothetical protein
MVGFLSENYKIVNSRLPLKGGIEYEIEKSLFQKAVNWITLTFESLIDLGDLIQAQVI